jgi:hypothetical protein
MAVRCETLQDAVFHTGERLGVAVFAQRTVQ